MIGEYNIITGTTNGGRSIFTTDDITVNNKFPNIHFFSNILDIQEFDINYLMKLVKNSYSGVNYFVCASPYIDDIKKGRIELFVKHFENKYNNSFELLHTSDRINGDPTWIIRLFKVEL